jgi:hypothetical protein
MRLPSHPFFTVVNIALLLGIAITTFFVDGLEWSVPAFTIFLAAISLVYLRSTRKIRAAEISKYGD